MSGFGGFTPEAYQQLQEAYNQQLSQADEVENAGVKVGKETLGVETAPFKADWLDKTGLWKYPDGKGDYMDAKQTQENLLAALQTTEEIEEEEEIDFDSLTDEELLEALDSILSEDDDDDDDGDEDEDLLLNILNEDEDEEIDGVSDEELDELINELTSEPEENELDLDELEAFVSQILGEDVVEEEDYDDDDVISISDKIAALKEELAVLSAGVDEEPTEEDPIEEEEEVTSDDESA